MSISASLTHTSASDPIQEQTTLDTLPDLPSAPLGCLRRMNFTQHCQRILLTLILKPYLLISDLNPPGAFGGGCNKEHVHCSHDILPSKSVE